MTETKNKNGKSGVYQNDNNSSFLGLTRESVGDKKIPDQVGDDGLTVGSGCSKIPAFAGMTENIGGAGMTDGVKRTGMTRRNKMHRDDGLRIGDVLTDSRLRRNEVLSHTRGERGRSMVEMLGVLAVAGVLSIGGVAGYRYAMDKMNANDIINEVRKRAVTASQQRILGHDINLSEYGDNGRIKGLYDVAVTNDYTGDKGFFALTVSAVPQRVCDEILKQDWAMPVEMAVGGVVVDDDIACAAGENEMLFAFANTLDNSHLPGEGGEDDNGDDEVDDGDDPWAQECGTNEYHDFNTGECVADDKCEEGKFWYEAWGSGSCLTCPDADNPVAGDGYSYMGTCTKCPGAKEGNTFCGYYCVYCPDGEACADQCCGEGEWCQYNTSTYNYECVSEKTEGECYSNSDCTGENQYCKLSAGCQAMNGTCKTISSTSVTINGTEYTASTDYMSYHAAENFCDALGKKLAPVTDGCTAEELAAVKANNYSGSCTGWARTTGKDYWTATKLSGCASYYVSNSSSVWSGHWYSYASLALCR